MTRIPREVENRATTTRAVYVPPSTLPVPTPQPGYSFRWIATAVLGQADPSNVSKKMREGWEPVRAEDHPELQLSPNSNGNVELGGLMLCKMPTDKVQARNEYYENHAQAQMESVDNNYLRNNDPRMPMFSEKKSTTSRGGGFGNGTK
jgi:hypothetical protein